MEKINQKLNLLISTPSDINEHLLTFKKYAERCDTIIEFGVRGIVSTWAFLSGKPKKLVGIDITHPSHFGGNLEEITNFAKEIGVDFTFRIENTLENEIEECDLLFIDTWHDYLQLKKELFRHSKNVKKYIILHDTSSFGFRNEPFYDDYESERNDTNLPEGLVPAMMEFLYSNPEWYILEKFDHNNGICIMARK